MQRSASFLAAAFVALSAGAAQATDYMVDAAHTEVGFGVRHMMVTDVHGAFDKFEGKVVLDDKDVTKSSVTVDVDTASINTKNQKRDDHLRSPDFFDAAKNPKLTFKSTKVEKGAKANMFKVTGDLTMHGVTKPVVLDVEVTDEVTDPKEWGGNVHRGAKATGKVSRADFGLKWNTALEKGGVVVGDEVTLSINAELIKAAPAAAKK